MAIVLATGGTIYGGTRWYLNSHTSMAGYDKTSKTIEVQVQKGNLTLGTTVSGTTEAGLAYQNFLLTFLEQNGYLPVVEEVYVAAGDSVEKGTALYKITEESIQSIEDYLTEVIKDAKKSYKEAKLQYDSDLLEAKMTYSENKNLASTASENYDSTVKSFSLEVESAKEKYEEAQNVIEEYPGKISKKENTIQSLKTKKASLAKQVKTLQSKADKKAETESSASEELQKAEQEKYLAENLYQNAKQYLEKKQGQAKSDITQEVLSKSDVTQEVQLKSDSTQKANPTAQPKTGLTKEENDQKEEADTNTAQKEKNGQGESQTDYSVMESYIAELKVQAEEAGKKYESKKGIYEKAKASSETAAEKLETKQTKLSQIENKLTAASWQLENLETELKNAENNIDAYKAAYDKAVVAQDTDQVLAEQEYENNRLTSGYADIIFRSAKKELEEQLNQAKEEVEMAENNLEQWRAWIGNGVITASEDGELASVGYEADTYISSMIPLVSYYDGNVLSIDVTIDQKDIGYISVGETLEVSVNGAFVEGTVAAIATERAESGASKVNYTVTVNIENTEGSYTSGQSAEMTFVKEELENVLYLPKQMILEDGKGSYAWVKNGEEKEKVYVQTGESNDSYVVLTDGLEEGQTCIYVEQEEQNEKEN